MKQRLARLLCVAMIAIMLATSFSMPALASYSAKIKTTTKVYKKPSKKSKSVKVTPRTVTVKEISGSWAKITYKGVTAYIPTKYLSSLKKSSSNSTVKRVKVYVTSSTAKVYKKPGSGKIATVTLGTTLYAVSKSGKYTLVQNKEGNNRGYVLTSCLSTVKPSASDWKPSSGSTSFTDISKLPPDLISTTKPSDDDDSPEALIEMVIYVAQNKMGAPYVHGKSGPNQFDCAGFTYYCYKTGTKYRDGGAIKLKGSSKGQGYDDSYEMLEEIDELERGDLVCFNTDPSDGDLSDHVGIYLGDHNGKKYFIHASSAAGQVIISRLDSGYYSRVTEKERIWAWGRRIIDLD